MLQACINGARRPLEHRALPVSVEAIARDVAAVAREGIDAVHLHVKDEHGADTLDPAAMVRVLAAVRAAAPTVRVGVTTGAWALPDGDTRVAAIRSWRTLDLLPDFASVNWHEERAEEIAAHLMDMGVGVEAGVWHIDGGHRWLASGARDRCIRVLVELPGGPVGPAIDAEAARLLALVDRAPSTHDGRVAVLLHGEEGSTWPVLRLAGRMSLPTRIGLEDVLVLPDGAPADDNVALVRAAREVLSHEGRSQSR